MYHVHHHHHHHLEHRLDREGRRRRRGEGRRGPGRDLDARIAFLEERQRDLEQAAADIASKIQWLRERAATMAATAPEAAPAAGSSDPGELA